MFSNDFIPIQDPKKGYGGTFLKWYTSNRYWRQERGRLIVVSDDAVPVIGQVWTVVIGLISSESRSTKPLLTDIGVKASDIYPFCRDFQTAMELRYVFIK